MLKKPICKICAMLFSKDYVELIAKIFIFNFQNYFYTITKTSCLSYYSRTFLFILYKIMFNFEK